MRQSDESLEQAIRKSRDVIRLSKQLVYALHRKDLDAAQELEIRLFEEVKNLKLISENLASINFSGSYKVAIQEFVEAVSFYDFVKGNDIRDYKELDVSIEYYLMGLCDLTGELVRKAINSVIDGDYQTALKIRDFVKELYGQFLEINFKNGELRKKFDSIKYDLKKLDDVVYELKIRDKI